MWPLSPSASWKQPRAPTSKNMSPTEMLAGSRVFIKHRRNLSSHSQWDLLTDTPKHSDYAYITNRWRKCHQLLFEKSDGRLTWWRGSCCRGRTCTFWAASRRNRSRAPDSTDPFYGAFPNPRHGRRCLRHRTTWYLNSTSTTLFSHSDESDLARDHWLLHSRLLASAIFEDELQLRSTVMQWNVCQSSNSQYEFHYPMWPQSDLRVESTRLG